MPAIEKLFTLEEAARILKVSTRTVLRYIAARKLKATNIGQWRISESALRKFLDMPNGTITKGHNSGRK